MEDLPQLWEEARLTERRQLLLTMLDAIYVDTVDEKSVVAIRPKPAFMPLFEIATTREGNDVVLITEKDLPPADEGSEASSPCCWWRRGRVELPVQKTPRENILQACPALLSRFSKLLPAKSRSTQPITLPHPHRCQSGSTLDLLRLLPYLQG